MPSADFQTHPTFKRGVLPHVRLLIYVTICVAMLAVDRNFHYLESLRTYLVTITYPLRASAAEPVKLVGSAAKYFSELADSQFKQADFERLQIENAQRLLRFEHLEQENGYLRKLLGMRKRVQTHSVAAEVLYSAPDPYSRKVILDQGKQEGVEPGLAVVDAEGLIGQITRVYPIQSEVTLITDRNQSVPVQVERNGQLGVMSGTGQGGLELRFVLADADIKAGDRLVTSGLDGKFAPGLPVAKIESIERDTSAFARIVCKPLGGVEQSTRVLVLSRAELPPPPPKPETGEPPPPPPLAAKRDPGDGG
ncbi:MAG: rod shape-determining protein MreC [Azoarcus sp.]|jgi:rod shape-determining protein MreC|nr:rod shape-determining protein MreC [Azoarcus sp.]